MKEFIVAVVASLVLAMGNSVAFAADSSDSNSTEFEITDAQMVASKVDLVAWKIK